MNFLFVTAVAVSPQKPFSPLPMQTLITSVKQIFMKPDFVANLLSGTVQVLKVTPGSDQLGATCHFSNSSLVVIPADKNLVN